MKKKPSPRSRGARLGQHFLTGHWAAAKLAACVGVRPDETILEIGPGRGVLTKELLKTGARIIAVEKDEMLVEQLRETFEAEIASHHLELVEGDIRNFNPRSYGLEAGSYVLAANIPYYITGEIIRKFLTADRKPRAMALLVQKEVAERIMGKVKGKRQKVKESMLSISVKTFGTPRIIARVSRGNFSPPPRVDSAILLIENISWDFFSDVDEQVFFKVVRAGFASKRKVLSSNLENFGFTKLEIVDVFAGCKVDKRDRAEDISLETWKCLARQLTENREQ